MNMNSEHDNIEGGSNILETMLCSKRLTLDLNYVLRLPLGT